MIWDVNKVAIASERIRTAFRYHAGNVVVIVIWVMDHNKIIAVFAQGRERKRVEPCENERIPFVVPIPVWVSDKVQRNDVGSDAGSFQCAAIYWLHTIPHCHLVRTERDADALLAG